MDEVDKIIVSSLRRIGCSIDEGLSMANFTPEQLVPAVVRCVEQIKPDAAVPRRTLPTENMAQRFTVASAVAELCAACGYRNDIGYQTFLYPNAVEVRRLFMFLIEQLPKSVQPVEEATAQPIGECEVLLREIKQKIGRELHSPWVPQYARSIGNRKHQGCSSQIVKFAPQLNLNVPPANSEAAALAPELATYLQQQAPTIFQQTAVDEYDLVSSVLHKNSLDVYRQHAVEFVAPDEQVEASKPATRDEGEAVVESQEATQKEGSPPATPSIKLSPLEQLNEEVSALKLRNDERLAERKATSARITRLKSDQAEVAEAYAETQRQKKLHERTCLVLDSSTPRDNLVKLEGLIATTRERRKKLDAQWQEYRTRMLQQLGELRSSKQTKNANDVGELRKTIAGLEETLRERSAHHGELSGELKRLIDDETIAPRKEYTRRIMEFVGNIRKQRQDIYKVLDDAHQLQKQLNSVEGQLHRQFNYTDDLLFQSAKHDIHAKQAYKLLALLHTTCAELVEVVGRTGTVTKECRDLEVNIDTEKMKNYDSSLKQISQDIANFETIIETVQQEIEQAKQV